VRQGGRRGGPGALRRRRWDDCRVVDAEVTWAQALSWRLERQFLDPVGSQSVAGVVGRLGAVLSMDEALAELAVRTRRRASEPGELTAALASGEVIKAFAFRGSMHYLSPEDGGIYLSLRAAGRQWERASWVEYYRLTASDWPDFRAAVRDALGEGPLTLAELGEAVTSHRAYRHLRPVFDGGAGTLIKPLTWQGDMSIGPARDGRPTFQRLDTNPRWRGIPDLDDAGPTAITTYLRAYGPATPEHLHYWLVDGLSAGRRRVQAWFGGLERDLVAVDVEGTRAYVLREDVDGLRAVRPSSDAVRLLPGHDQWVIGPGTSDAHVTPAARRGLMTRKANPVIAGGVVCGTWVRSADALAVTWLDERPRPDEAIEAEAARLGGILGRDLRLVMAS
jgi:Winged helix DNA-binding domain